MQFSTAEEYAGWSFLISVRLIPAGYAFIVIPLCINELRKTSVGFSITELPTFFILTTLPPQRDVAVAPPVFNLTEINPESFTTQDSIFIR